MDRPDLPCGSGCKVYQQRDSPHDRHLAPPLCPIMLHPILPCPAPQLPTPQQCAGITLFCCWLRDWAACSTASTWASSAGALPYLEATSRLTAAELSVIVAAVLLGSVFSTLFAGLLADWMGRKPLMILSGLTFVVSIPVIALSQGYGPLFFGRLLQGISGGLIGVVVPLYLAECLCGIEPRQGNGDLPMDADAGHCCGGAGGDLLQLSRGGCGQGRRCRRGAWLSRDQAWRRIFWVSLPPGVLFVLGSLFVTESPRWLFRRGAALRAHTALLRSRSAEQAALEIEEMAANAHAAGATLGKESEDSLLQRKYAIPFLLACVILACNTATGVNSLIGYNTSILLQSGLSDLMRIGAMCSLRR